MACSCSSSVIEWKLEATVIRLALAFAMVSAWLLAAPVGVSTAQAQVNVNINVGKGGFEGAASPVARADGSSSGADSAMCVSGAARDGSSSMPDAGAATITGSRSGAATVRLFQSAADDLS